MQASPSGQPSFVSPAGWADHCTAYDSRTSLLTPPTTQSPVLQISIKSGPRQDPADMSVCTTLVRICTKSNFLYCQIMDSLYNKTDSANYRVTTSNCTTACLIHPIPCLNYNLSIIILSLLQSLHCFAALPSLAKYILNFSLIEIKNKKDSLLHEVCFQSCLIGLSG